MSTTLERITERAACAQPCATCPWLARNQTREAVKASPIDGGGRHWFAPANLKKHWRGIGRGSLMPCHATDPNAPTYGGKAAPRGAEPRICVGLTILARREVVAYLSTGSPSVAKHRARGGIRFTIEGLATWAARLLHPGAVFETFSLTDGLVRLRLPATEDHPDVRLPWDDKVVNP